MQGSSVRDFPSIDDVDLHNLRPDGYQSMDAVGEGGDGKQRTTEAQQRNLPRAASNTRSEALSAVDDGFSRPISATSAASVAAGTQSKKPRRRVHIADDDDGDDDDDDADKGAQSLRLPGQTPSFTSHHHQQQQQGGQQGRHIVASASTATNSAAWQSLGRVNMSPLAQLPPEDLPALHSAAWYNDLDTLLELLKTTQDPLRNLIWVNPKLYPQAYAATGAGGDSTVGPADAARRLKPPPRLGQPLPGSPPEKSCPVSATAALKSLLRQEYLHHACHPLTIAAAHGNERIVDELLKAMLEETQAGKGEHTLTWRTPPPELPPGCPWVTPMGAAALGGNGECVRLLAQAIARRKSLTEDRSTYGCFRFRPVVVAQSADVVTNLFKYGCCHADTLRYSLCDAARRIAKLDCGCMQRASAGGHPPSLPASQPASQAPSKPPSQNRIQRSTSGGDAATGGDAASPPDSPRTARQGSRTDTTDPHDAPGTGASLYRTPAASTTSLKSALAGGGSGHHTQHTTKAAELMLFRARLFHDCLGRPLSKALCELQQETLVAMASLSAMLENGLEPDRFLSHEEHPNLTSTSLLMIVTRNYRSLLQSAAGGSGAAGIIGCMPLTPLGGGGGGGGGEQSFGASSMSMSSSRTAAATASTGGDMLSITHDVVNTLVSGLLTAGAMVDEPPRAGCRQVGGFHVAPPHGPEAPLHHAFIHGPQELVVMLLQFSSLQPETHEDLARDLTLLDRQDSAEGGGGGEPAKAQGDEVERKDSAAREFYGRKAAVEGGGKSRRKPKLPWEGGRSSPLLAFGAKMQGALLEGNLPLWLHSARFSELMEDLIKCTIASDACSVTTDLNWLVVELFERCMAHEYDGLAQARLLLDSQQGSARHTGTGSGDKDDSPDGAKPPTGFYSTGQDSTRSESTIITVGPGNLDSSPRKSAKPADARSEQGPGGPGRSPHGHSHAHGGSRHKKAFDERGGVATAPNTAGAGGRPSSASTASSSSLSDSETDSDGSSSEAGHRAAGVAAGGSGRRPDGGGSSGGPSGGPRLARQGKIPQALLSTADDSILLSSVHSLYRHTADAITNLHQSLCDGTGLDGPLASLSGSVGGGAATLVSISASAGLVDWTALLRLVARIAATTLNPPKRHGAGAGQISVFTTAKAVNQLLYARDWAQETEGGGEVPAESVIDIDLLRAVARRHPHEAARLIHGIDLMRVELKGYRWDSIPMSLDQDFYAVLSKGEAIKLSSRCPTVAPVSVAVAAEAAVRAAERQGGGGGGWGKRGKGVKGRGGGSQVYPTSTVSGGGASLPVSPDAGALMLTASHGPGTEEELSREDLLQACIWVNMWTVLTHFLLSSTRLPGYMRSLEALRIRTYKFAVLGQVFTYGSIPVVIGMGLAIALLGLLARCLQRTAGFIGNLILAVYGRLEQRLQPAMSHMGRKMRLDRVQRRMDRMVRRVDRLAQKATGGNLNIAVSSRALQTVRIIPRYLSFLRVLLDPDALAEVWLGVTQHYSRGRGKLKEEEGGAGADENGGPAYLSWRTTRVICNRVPLSCAAAMPSSLLYKLAASPQVNGELFASPVMRAVITWRWQHYTRYFLLLQCLEHLMYMTLFMVYAFSLSYNTQMFSSVLGEARTAVVVEEGCSQPPSGLQKFLLISLGVMTLSCVVQELRQLVFFRLGWLKQPWNLMDFASSTIMATIITLHLDCRTDVEFLRGLAAIEVALLFLRLLYFAMADDRLGSFFRMVIEVLRDCWLFFVFLGILFVGWGLALTVLQGDSSNIQDTYLQLFTMIFGDFSKSLLESADAGSRGLNYLWRMFVSVYQIMVTIILLNLLIAIINDSYERINDNETCESLRNKLFLIVEAESVMPAGMARRMLESLAKKSLYVITAEAATVTSSNTMEQEGNAGENGTGGGRRPLAPPSRWTGRMGETKRFILNIVDQLSAQQAHFQARVMSILTGMTTIKAAADVMPSGAGAMPSTGRDGTGGPSSKRLSAVGPGGVAASAAGMRGVGPATVQVAPMGSMIDMGDAEAFAQVLDLGKLLRDKLQDLRGLHEESQRQQDESWSVMSKRMNEAMERVGREVARAAAESAAMAAVAASSARMDAEGLVGKVVGMAGSLAAGLGSGSGRCGSGAGQELVVVERAALELIAQRAAEQAAQMAVEGVLRELGRGGRVDG